MIYFTTPSILGTEYANSFVITAANKLFARRTVVDINDSGDVVLMDMKGCPQIPHIECMQIAVFVGSREDKRFHWIPRDIIGTHLKNDFTQRLCLSSVEQLDTSITGGADTQISLNWIEFHTINAIDSPFV